MPANPEKMFHGKPWHSSVCIAGHHHQSKGEAGYCNMLLDLVEKGEIETYRVWPSMRMRYRGKRINWKIDFVVHEKDGSLAYHEYHPILDHQAAFKRDAFTACFPGIKLYFNGRLWVGKVDRPWLNKRLAGLVKRNKRAAATRKILAKRRRQFLEGLKCQNAASKSGKI